MVSTSAQQCPAPDLAVLTAAINAAHHNHHPEHPAIAVSSHRVGGGALPVWMYGIEWATAHI